MEGKKIILVTGGQRSGKSRYAEQLALRLSPNPVYLATSRVLDDEMRRRVKNHQERRSACWTNIEEPLWLGSIDVSGSVVLVDCLTMWATNTFFYCNEDVDLSLQRMRDEFERFTSQNATFIFVTNEIGSGGVSDNAMQRRFTDLQGWFNQYAAQQADDVFLLVSGIPLKIK